MSTLRMRLAIDIRDYVTGIGKDDVFCLHSHAPARGSAPLTTDVCEQETTERDSAVFVDPPAHHHTPSPALISFGNFE